MFLSYCKRKVLVPNLAILCMWRAVQGAQTPTSIVVFPLFSSDEEGCNKHWARGKGLYLTMEQVHHSN